MAESVRGPVDELAQEIRRVDGNHDLGAGALAEKLWPYIEELVDEARGAGYDDGRLDAELEYNSSYR